MPFKTFNSSPSTSKEKKSIIKGARYFCKMLWSVLALIVNFLTYLLEFLDDLVINVSLGST